MKFFIELVACCGCSSNRAHRPAEDEEILVTADAEASFDHNNNIITYKKRRRRRRTLARSAGSLPEWKPSLSSISEDGIAANSSRNLKKKKVSVNQLHHHRRPQKPRIACLAQMVPSPFLI
ncbi:uncharacterized protein LOC132045814 [Lycium ferocissimum]|uniref:uncharacterized protein LOC132045814 n=1 Tax=Lycium ferocissimum TaxID=112874 RepID=UPI002814F842|nr:uncharacterized protein LOC132045814 [Lycium ferocissimum]